MKLKRRLCVLLVVILSLLCLYVITMVSKPLEKLNRRDLLLPRLGSKWKHCTIPTDIDKLCSGNITEGANLQKCPLEELSQDCTLLREVHGYDKPVDKEEMDFPLAFGLKMHTAPEQAEQLLRTIYRPHNVYCIHVDKKADDAVLRVMTSIAACFPNVILTDGINFVYGSYDSIRTELRTMTCALESTVRWRYYLNLAGQEFPLKTNLEMVRILKLFNGTNDIESFPVPKAYQKRFAHKYRLHEGHLQNTTVRKEPPTFKVEIRRGRQYSAFSRAFVAFIFFDDEAKSIMDYFRDTFYPEENIWATVNQLPWIPGGFPVHVKHSRKNEHISRAVAWKYEDSYRCKGNYVREVCIFTKADLPWLLSLPNLFANKFRLDMDSLAVVCLEAVIDQRTRSRGVTIDPSFYRNLPHVKFRHQQAISSHGCICNRT